MLGSAVTSVIFVGAWRVSTAGPVDRCREVRRLEEGAAQAEAQMQALSWQEGGS